MDSHSMVTKWTSSFKRRDQNSPAKHQRHVEKRIRTKTRHLNMFVHHHTNAELLRATELSNQGKCKTETEEVMHQKPSLPLLRTTIK